jgi:hypothetical protein
VAGPHRSAALPREDASASLFFPTSAVLTILVVAAGLVSLVLVIVPTGLATLLILLFLLAGVLVRIAIGLAALLVVLSHVGHPLSKLLGR